MAGGVGRGAGVASVQAQDAVPLTTVRPGQLVRLVRILAGRRATHRLVELGLTPGVEVEVIRSDGGPLLVGVRGGRLALGRGVAQRILVREPPGAR